MASVPLISRFGAAFRGVSLTPHLGVHARNPESGFALVSVLWGSLVLALIVASVLAISRTETRLAHNRLAIVKLDAIDDAAINIAILRLVSPSPPAQPPVDGTPFVLSFAGHRVRVSVQDEIGKININMAQAPLLRRILRVAGLDPVAAHSLVDKILDWRERGFAKHLNGAEAQDYHDAGYSYGPRNGPFESVGELQLVMGITPSLFKRIAPWLTVYSQSAWVDPRFAPKGVLRALSWLKPSATASLPDQRAASRQRGEFSSAIAQQSAPVVMAGHAFTISATADSAAGIRASRSAVIRLTGSRDPAFWVYRWD